MRKFHLLLILVLFQFHISAQVDPYSPDPNPPAILPGYKLSWSDEFNYTGKPSSANWSYETGFVRNEEHQWYQSDNANVSNGTLQITGRKERVKNPNYQSGSSDWKKNREYAEALKSEADALLEKYCALAERTYAEVLAKLA